MATDDKSTRFFLAGAAAVKILVIAKIIGIPVGEFLRLLATLSG